LESDLAYTLDTYKLIFGTKKQQAYKLYTYTVAILVNDGCMLLLLAHHQLQSAMTKSI
jgi:hypothetical protein